LRELTRCIRCSASVLPGGTRASCALRASSRARALRACSWRQTPISVSTAGGWLRAAARTRSRVASLMRMAICGYRGRGFLPLPAVHRAIILRLRRRLLELQLFKILVQVRTAVQPYSCTVRHSEDFWVHAFIFICMGVRDDVEFTKPFLFCMLFLLVTIHVRTVLKTDGRATKIV
jgi:hypothetical protein